MQILGVTCDNAANNEVMIDELANLAPDFRGASSRARCFLHVVNLVAKSIIRIFDIKKKDVDAALASGDVVVEWNELAAAERARTRTRGSTRTMKGTMRVGGWTKWNCWAERTETSCWKNWFR